MHTALMVNYHSIRHMTGMAGACGGLWRSTKKSARVSGRKMKENCSDSRVFSPQGACSSSTTPLLSAVTVARPPVTVTI